MGEVVEERADGEDRGENKSGDGPAHATDCKALVNLELRTLNFELGT